MQKETKQKHKKIIRSTFRQPSVFIPIFLPIHDVSVLISELVTRFEEAAAPNHKASEYSETQISMLQRATQALENLCSEKVSVTSLVDAARTVVAAGSQPRFSKPRLVVSNP